MTRASFPNLLLARKYWFALYEQEAISQPPLEFMKVFKEHKTDKKEEKFHEVVGFSVMEETDEYNPAPLDAIMQGYNTTLTPKSYSKRAIISRELWDDEQWGVFQRYVQYFRNAEHETRAILGASVFNGLFTTTGWDSQYIIDTDHPREDGGGTISNKLATNAELSATSLEQAFINMSYITDGRGKTLHIKPKYLVVPKALKFDAMRAVQKGGKPGTSDNDHNFIGDENLIIVVFPWLSSSSAWFLVHDGVGKVSHPLKSMNRVPFETDLEHDFDRNKAYKVRCYMRCKYGTVGWRGLYGSTGA